MWHLETTPVSVIVGPQDMIKKRKDKNISKIPSSPSRYEILKIALCVTAYLLRRILSA